MSSMETCNPGPKSHDTSGVAGFINICVLFALAVMMSSALPI